MHTLSSLGDDDADKKVNELYAGGERRCAALTRSFCYRCLVALAFQVSAMRLNPPGP
jgi:hypothetical protein